MSFPNFDNYLTVLANEFHGNQQRSGTLLAPIIPVGEASAKYPVWDAANDLRVPKPEDLRRAPMGEYGHSGITLSETAYSTEDKGHKVGVDDTMRKRYSNIINYSEAAMQRVINVIALGHEQEVRDYCYSTSVGNSTPTTLWSDDASTPDLDIEVEIEAMLNDQGIEPNMVHLSRPVYNRLKRHPRALDRFYKSRTATNQVLNTEQVAEFLGVPRVEVGGGFMDSARDGQIPNIDRIWNQNHVILAYVDGSRNIEAPRFLGTLTWTEDSGGETDVDIVMESYREEKIRTEWFQGHHFNAVVAQGSGLAHRFNSVL